MQEVDNFGVFRSTFETFRILRESKDPYPVPQSITQAGNLPVIFSVYLYDFLSLFGPNFAFRINFYAAKPNQLAIKVLL